MVTEAPNAHTGQLLTVDLTRGGTDTLALDGPTLRKYVGGTALGARLLADSVPPQVAWNDSRNRLLLLAGPLAGTSVAGTGTFSVVFKGPMTELAGASQASGLLGAFIRFCGFDGIVVDGASPAWKYLYVHDGGAELRDATPLLGKTTRETEAAIGADLGLSPQQVSVYAIGPAGEHLVRFAALAGDQGHVAAHNGVGAVFGSKRLKAVAVAKGSTRVPVRDRPKLRVAAKALLEHARQYGGGTISTWGTAGLLGGIYRAGMLPIRNYTTSLFPEYERFTGQQVRANFPVRVHPCWACGVNHLRDIGIPSGPYAGFEGEEPEYECMAAWGPLTGQTDPAAAMVLTGLTDGLGLDANESGWTIAWVMECYEKGILTKSDLDGVEMTWGNVESVRTMLRKIAFREGVGDLLAEGVMRASRRVGGDAPNLGVYTLKGASPRGHDHRGRWYEMLDTATSGTSTIEASFGIPPAIPGVPPLEDMFSPQQVSEINARVGGWRQFEDCLGICRFCSTNPTLVVDCVNAVTGWDMTLDEAMTVGRRSINLLRLFNLRHGLDPATEAPSPRYGSTPVDGPAQGKGIMPHWDWMVRHYREMMGWDPATGRPLPETLRSLGLEEIPD